MRGRAPIEAAVLDGIADAGCQKYGIDCGELDAALRDLAKMDALDWPVRPWRQQSAH